MYSSLLLIARSVAAIILAAAVSAAPASANDALFERLDAALRESAAAGVPIEAEIRFEGVTPVRGDIDAALLEKYDPRTGRFIVLLEKGGAQRRIAGRAIIETPLPAPVRAISPGEIITADALGVVMAPLQRVTGDLVSDAAALIGMEARRSLAVGRPIGKSAVGSPILVKRNSIVTVSLAGAHLRLTAKARALEDGGAGDVIKAMNLDGSVVAATVTGADRLSIAQ